MIVCETVGLRTGSRIRAVQRNRAANMGPSQRCRKQIVQTSVKPKMRGINNLVPGENIYLVHLFSHEVERTASLGSIRTALAGPMTRARRAIMIIKITTKALWLLADALQSQIHVALEQKKSNLEKVNPELTRSSGKPSPCKSWCRTISSTIFVILAIGRNSYRIQLAPSGRHGHDLANPVLLQRPEMLQGSKWWSMTQIVT